MNSEGGGIRSEQGAIHMREGMEVGGQGRRWRLASLVWGGMQWTALAIHCHWAVDGGCVALAWRVAIEEGGYLLIH